MGRPRRAKKNVRLSMAFYLAQENQSDLAVVDEEVEQRGINRLGEDLDCDNSARETITSAFSFVLYLINVIFKQNDLSFCQGRQMIEVIGQINQSGSIYLAEFYLGELDFYFTGGLNEDGTLISCLNTISRLLFFHTIILFQVSQPTRD